MSRDTPTAAAKGTNFGTRKTLGVLTNGGQDGGGVVESSGKLPLLAGLVRDALQHHRLQQLEVIRLNAVVLPELMLDLCRKDAKI